MDSDDVSTMMRRDFEHFGPIETVELLKNGKNEAYVTYYNDGNAYLATCAFDESKNDKYIVQPADTWHQPKLVEEENNCFKPSPISILNKHCFLEVFERCGVDTQVNLAQVCPYFDALLHRYCFSKYKKLSIEIDWDANDAYGRGSEVILTCNLAKIREYLRCIGPYIEKLEIECYSIDNFKFHRLFEKLSQYVGSNIRSIILYLRISTDDMLLLRPILQPITELDVREIIFNGKQLNLSEVCPNLYRLRIAKGLKTIQESDRLPNLKSFINHHFDYPDEVSTFFARNPQIEKLVLCGANFNETMHVIVENLRDLRELSYICQYTNIESGCEQLKYLPNLVKLHLTSMDTGYSDDIITQIARCRGLRDLNLSIFAQRNRIMTIPSHRSFIGLAENLTNLKHFDLSNIELNERTIVAIVRQAERLETFHIHSFDRAFVATQFSLIEKIFAVTQNKRKTFTLYVDAHVPSDIPSGDDYCIQYFSVMTDRCCSLLATCNAFVFKGASNAEDLLKIQMKQRQDEF